MGWTTERIANGLKGSDRVALVPLADVVVSSALGLVKTSSQPSIVFGWLGENRRKLHSGQVAFSND
jgi:hypothetical protein